MDEDGGEGIHLVCSWTGSISSSFPTHSCELRQPLFCYFQFITYTTLCVAIYLLFTGVCVYDKTDQCLLLQGCVQPFIFVKCYICHICS